MTHYSPSPSYLARRPRKQGAGIPISGAGEDLVRSLEGDASWLRNRSRQRVQERLSGAVDVPPQQHGIVFMHGVVAVLHEHAAPIAELHPDDYSPIRTKAVHILASALCRRRRAAVAGNDLALFK